MRYTNCALAMMMVAVSALCIGQQSAPVTPAQPVDVSATPVRDTHSNKADLKVPLCPAKFEDSLATDGIAGQLREEGVKPPMVLHSAEAEFSNEARKLRRKGQELDFIVIMGLIVGPNGGLKNICISRSVGYGLDAKAAEAVRQFQFAPATKDGQPVAARIHIEVDFHMD
jgi:TonB family protein